MDGVHAIAVIVLAVVYFRALCLAGLWLQSEMRGFSLFDHRIVCDAVCALWAVIADAIFSLADLSNSQARTPYYVVVQAELNEESNRISS